MNLQSIVNRLGLGAEQRSNPLNDPSVPISSPAVWQWLTGGEPTAAGETVNEANALQITTVYSCVRVIAEAAAGCTCKLFKVSGNGKQLAIDELLYYLLAIEPNPEMSAVVFWETIYGCQALTGNAYAQIERNKNREPVALWPLHPLKTQPFRRPQDNKIAFKTSDGMTLGTTREIPAVDVLHLPLFSWDGLCGLSPIGLARQSLGLAKATEKFGARFFGNGTRPGGIMTNKGPKTDPKQQAEVSESWNRQHGGTNQGKTAFLSGDWTYQQIGLSPEDSQFLATREYQRSDIAGLFHVPPHKVGDTTRLSNKNHEQEELSFVTDGLRPYLGRGECEITRKLLPRPWQSQTRYVVSCDVSERLKGDFATTQQGYLSGRNGGWYTANDVLRKLGENVGGPELDIYIVPVNYQNAKRLIDTESIQDQPVDTDPNALAPTPAERSFLGPMAQAYIPLFRDAVGRFVARSKRDYDSISACFTPVLSSLAEEAKRQASAEFDLTDDWDVGSQRTIKAALKSIESRATSWVTEDAGKISAIELTKAVRSILLNTYREAGAAKAMKGIAYAAAE